MSLRLRVIRRPLRFSFPARTSRGALTEHIAHYLVLDDPTQPQRLAGVGEASPLAGLSPDEDEDFFENLQALAARFTRAAVEEFSPEAALRLVPAALPAVRFGLETAALDWANGGHRQLFDTPFSRGEAALPINGLIWMGDAGVMREQIARKLEEGYACLKLKIGALDFATECAILREIRAVAGPDRLTLRVDANGAFSATEAPDKLAALAEFELHSIEQPLAPGQPAALARLWRESAVPIALDEELIGLTTPAAQAELLDHAQPAFIVLKPTLLGGLAATRGWVAAARARGIGWWLTSALESNIGLSAIAQLAADLEVGNFPQGLGTGQLYEPGSNPISPLRAAGGWLRLEADGVWENVG
ncbi:MAG: o-succinylbenzoate synthase [Hymenobacteraceae bacterium]|nr:o-succinylbenzoate synthase [Hymenobacteraceae bacterium]